MCIRDSDIGHLQLGTNNTTQITIGATGNTTFAGKIYSTAFYDSDNTAYYLNPSATSRLNDANVLGNVGVGLENPASKLEIISTAAIRSAANAQHKFKFEARNTYYDDTSSAGMWISDGSSGNEFSGEGAHLVIEGRKHTSRDIYIKVGDTTTPQHVFYRSGNVGIGELTPLSKLEVAGSIKATNRDSAHTSEAGLTLSLIHI